jgi:ribosomal protein S18 acetylase RimI-like enzyme
MVKASIRFAVQDDAVELAALAERTFRDTFAADNNVDDMEAHCAKSYSPTVQAQELADAAMHTIVAVDADQRLIAYAQLRPGAPSCAPTAPAPHEVWRFYVDRAHHGTGLAQALMDAVVQMAQDGGALTLWLGVWEQNSRAQAFYRKCGFIDIGSHHFRLGTDLQTDRVMSRDLRGIRR